MTEPATPPGRMRTLAVHGAIDGRLWTVEVPRAEWKRAGSPGVKANVRIVDVDRVVPALAAITVHFLGIETKGQVLEELEV